MRRTPKAGAPAAIMGCELPDRGPLFTMRAFQVLARSATGGKRVSRGCLARRHLFPQHQTGNTHMSNPYQEIARDREAALRGTRPAIANDPNPAQDFGRGARTGAEAAVSREVKNTDSPRRE
jgi:hypothetical protein